MKVTPMQKETPGEETLAVDQETEERDREQEEAVHPQPQSAKGVVLNCTLLRIVDGGSGVHTVP